MPTIDIAALTKGEARKLNALRKSVGDELGKGVFIKWKEQQAIAAAAPVDPVATRLLDMLSAAGLQDDRTFRLGAYGYTVRRARGQRRNRVCCDPKRKTRRVMVRRRGRRLRGRTRHASS